MWERKQTDQQPTSPIFVAPVTTHVLQDTVGNTMPLVSARGRDVPSNIYASNVKANTPVRLVRDHPHQNQALHPALTESEGGLPTPINVGNLESIGRHYCNIEYLASGFKRGFNICYEGPSQCFEIQNHTSALGNEDILLSMIHKEILLGRVSGPHLAPPLPHFIVSPLGLVPKKEPGIYRVIHDLSLPSSNSVNSFIEDHNASVQYETFDNVITLVIQAGYGALLAKADILEAFRIIPVRPEDYHLLGFKIGALYYYDKVLPMGCRSSCQIFESFSKCLQWVIKNVYGFPSITHMLDDFIFVGKRTEFECLRGLKSFLALATYLNIPIKTSKTVYPTTCVTVYGIEIDTLAMQARLPTEKLSKAVHLIESIIALQYVSLKSLQKLLGLLNFCCRCVKPGRPFLRRVWDLCKSSVSNSHKIQLKTAAKQDLLAWLLFLRNFNGITLLHNSAWLTSDDLQLFTDAAQSKGYSFVLGNKWYCDSWPEKLKQLNIVILELLPIVMAISFFACELENKCIMLNTDNQALVHIINNQSSKCKITMALLRRLVVQCLIHNITVNAVHLSSQANLLADLLSRLKVEEAMQLFPQLEVKPITLPRKLQPCSLMQHL